MAGDKEALLGMGFESARVDWALRATRNAGLQPALDFLFAHTDDPIPDPAAQASSGASAGAAMDVDEDDAETLRAVTGESSVGPEAKVRHILLERRWGNCGKTFKDTDWANFHASKSGHDQFEESTEEVKPLTDEERTQKLAYLREKLAEKRKEKSVEEMKEMRENEAIRRKAGKDAGSIRQDLEAKEAIKAAESARREKLDEARARAEVKRKIEEDKAERRERAEREKALRAGGSVPVVATPAAPAPTSGTASVAGRDYKETRLQIRLTSGGKPYVTTLPSESTLLEVAEYLASQTLSVDADTVSFAMHYPKKQFSRGDFSKTLRELGLTPSAEHFAPKRINRFMIPMRGVVLPSTRTFMNASSSNKRPRGDDHTPAGSSRSSTPSPSLTPTAKAQRIANHVGRAAAPLLCTLPPTCHPPRNAPTALADSQELEAHYAKFHAHVCADKSCAAVFPNARLLELHQTECHNPLALVRKERGEKIFACHLEFCSRLFINPKKRRLHLIQVHGFPKEYFFAVTNKGVGGLLKRWGEGASLIRGSWKARDDEGRNEEVMEVEGNGIEEGSDDSDDDESKDEEMPSAGTVNADKLPSTDPRKTENFASKKGDSSERQSRLTPAKIPHAQNDDVDRMINSMGSLSLVPPSIRFGRGGKSGQMVRQSQAGHGSKHAAKNHRQSDSVSQIAESAEDVDISINIDAALEALKDEASSNSVAKQGGRGALSDLSDSLDVLIFGTAAISALASRYHIRVGKDCSNHGAVTLLPMIRKFFLLAALTVCISLTYGQLDVSSTPSQVMHGIGASGAWWPNDLVNYPEGVREKAAEFLFGSTGAGLTSYRYNVGGGGVFVGTPARAPETFYVSPGVYNWSADAAGVYFLKKAAEHNVPVLTAFVNSAPPAFTSNNRSCGGTLVDAQIPAYAQYLADVIAHFKEEGIVITHVSPMNEPDDNFSSNNVTPCGQEGMIVTPEQRASVVNTLRSTLDAANLTSVGIMADESSSTGNFIPEAPTWIPEAASSLAAVCHHQYGFGSDSTVAQMGEIGRNLSGKNTWFTEICCYATADSASDGDPAAPLTYSGIYEPTIIGALQLGQIVYQSFTQILDAHFDFWTALSSGIGCSPLGNANCPITANPNGWNDGLVYYDPDYATNENFALYTTKRLFVMKHFANFIWMGATRFDVAGLPDNVFGLLFKVDQPQRTDIGQARTSFILMNMGNTTTDIDLSPVGLGTPVGGARTSQQVDWETLGAGLSKSVTLPVDLLLCGMYRHPFASATESPYPYDHPQCAAQTKGHLLNKPSSSSLAHLLPTSGNIDMRKVSHKETLYRPQHDFVVHKSGVTLTLKGQEENANGPSYGRGGIVEGTIDLTNPAGITKVEARIEGHVIQHELGAHGPDRAVVLSELLVCWDAPDDNSPAEYGGGGPSTLTLAFKASLPTYYTEADGESAPLPPSFREVLPDYSGFRGEVSYSIKVVVARAWDMKLRSLASQWKRNVVLNVPFEYSPQTRPSVPPPFSVKAKSSKKAPSTRFYATIELDSLHAEPVKTKLYLPNSQITPMWASIPFFLKMNGPKAVISSFSKPPSSSFLPKAAPPSSVSLAGFIRQHITEHLQSFRGLSSSPNGASDDPFLRMSSCSSSSSQESLASPTGPQPKIRVALEREVSIDSRLRRHSRRDRSRSSDHEEENPRRVHKRIVLGEGFMYTANATRDSVTWAGEICIDPQHGVRCGGFQTRSLAVKPTSEGSVLQEFRQTIPVQLTTDSF
ncbi:hypothetical protein EW145_g3034 [Phellinidium pouzarii]|uniref:UBX domain-containing protein n=1 Tax=Phellinidium pouzarii TaxID=167371 RepID=A0A4S4L8L9_9AGAM|nr:hypothetical protein EW145_g3034 [Phellinidium pouzarii]